MTYDIRKVDGPFPTPGPWSDLVDAALADEGAWLEITLPDADTARRAANSIRQSARANVTATVSGNLLRWMATAK